MPSQLVATLCFLAATAQAGDARINFLIRQLQNGTDPRSRVQAAVMLGSRGDAVVVPFLCKALSDRDESVQLAVVKALGQLPTPESLSCLRNVNDPAPAVRAAIGRTLGPPKQSASLYIRLEPAVDQTDSRDPVVTSAVNTQLQVALAQIGATLAAPNETKAQAIAFTKRRNLRGFAILPEIKSIPGGLQLTLICSSYPDRALLGEVNVRGTGATPVHLIRALVPKAINEAAQTFDWSQ